MSFSEQVRDRPPFVGHVGGFSLPVCQLSRGGQRGRKLLPGWRRCGTRRPEWGLELLGFGLGPTAHTAFLPQRELTSGDGWLPPVVHGAQGAGLSATLVMLVVTCETPYLHVFLFLSQAVHS